MPCADEAGVGMAAEQQGRRRWPKWILLGIAVLAAALVVLGITLGGEDPSTPVTEPTSVGSGSDGGGGGGPADPSDPSAPDEPTEPPRDIAIDPQQSRPTESPEPAPVPTDGAGAELEPVAPEAVVDTSRGAVISLA